MQGRHATCLEKNATSQDDDSHSNDSTFQITAITSQAKINCWQRRCGGARLFQNQTPALILSVQSSFLKKI